MQIGFLGKFYTGVKTLAHKAVDSPMLKTRKTIFTENFPIAKTYISSYQIKYSLRKSPKKSLIDFLKNFPLKIDSEDKVINLLGILKNSGKYLKQTQKFSKDLWQYIPQKYMEKNEPVSTIMHCIKPDKLRSFEQNQITDLYEKTDLDLNINDFCRFIKNCDPKKLKIWQENNYGNIPKEIFKKFNDQNIIELVNEIKPEKISSISQEKWQRILKYQDKIEGHGIIRYLKTGKKEELLNTVPKVKLIKHIEGDGYQAFNSEILPINNHPPKGVELSNFVEPRSSVAIKTKPDEAIYTAGLFQCAGLAIYDTKTNTQSLSHVFVRTSSSDIKKDLLKLHDSEAFQEPGRLKISMVNGCYVESEDTMNRALEVLHSINPESAKSVKFRHIPDDDHQMIGIHNGELFAIRYMKSNKNSFIKATNPMDRIVYS